AQPRHQAPQAPVGPAVEPAPARTLVVTPALARARLRAARSARVVARVRVPARVLRALALAPERVMPLVARASAVVAPDPVVLAAQALAAATVVLARAALVAVLRAALVAVLRAAEPVVVLAAVAAPVVAAASRRS